MQYHEYDLLGSNHIEFSYRFKDLTRYR